MVEVLGMNGLCVGSFPAPNPWGNNRMIDVSTGCCMVGMHGDSSSFAILLVSWAASSTTKDNMQPKPDDRGSRITPLRIVG